MRCAAIIFDLDGTLLDTLADLANSVNTVLATHGLPVHDIDAYRYFVGDGVRVLMQRVLPQGEQSDDKLDAFVAAFRQEYDRNWNVETRPFDGVPEMLDALTARRLPLAVLSNKPDNYTKMCVAELLPRWTFDIVVGSRPDVPRKPDATAALEIARSLAAAPGQILYLGDTDVDMKTAARAGMFPVGALWGYRSREELEAGGARALVEHPSDLLALLSE